MTQPERQQLFLETIKTLKKASAFTEAMAKESVTRATALTLFQLTESSHAMALKLLNTLGGDTSPRIE